MKVRLNNTVRRHRESAGLSQRALADHLGVTRQAIAAVESGRHAPATSLALGIARVLRCTVEELFRLADPDEIEVEMASSVNEGARRAVVARVEGRWVAHNLAMDDTRSADAIIRCSGSRWTARPLQELDTLENKILVAGCAPLLGTLAERLGSRFSDARMGWISASSQRAVSLLGDRLVHVAGVHFFDLHAGQDHEAAVRRHFPGQRMLIVNLTRWQQGLVLPPGNPRRLLSAADLKSPGLTMARRESGAGAHKLLAQILLREGATELAGPLALGHMDVARLVACGAADVGVAIEAAALAAGLEFVPLTQERFDLVIPAALASSAPVSRLVDTLDDRGFRQDVAHMPGYDGSICGHAVTVAA